MIPMDNIRETDLGNEISVFDDKIKKILEVYASEMEKSKDFGDEIKRSIREKISKKWNHQKLNAMKLKHRFTIFKSGLQGVWGMPGG